MTHASKITPIAMESIAYSQWPCWALRDKIAGKSAPSSVKRVLLFLFMLEWAHLATTKTGWTLLFIMIGYLSVSFTLLFSDRMEKAEIHIMEEALNKKIDAQKCEGSEEGDANRKLEAIWRYKHFLRNRWAKYLILPAQKSIDLDVKSLSEEGKLRAYLHNKEPGATAISTYFVGLPSAMLGAYLLVRDFAGFHEGEGVCCVTTHLIFLLVLTLFYFARKAWNTYFKMALLEWAFGDISPQEMAKELSQKRKDLT